VSDVSSASSAAEYIRRNGADFGFATNDADNSVGAYAVAQSGLFYAEPWVGAVRTADMHLVQHDAQWGFDLGSLARSLAQE
jgi:hypothetical protein